MNRHLAIKMFCFFVLELRNSPAITCIPRLESEHFNYNLFDPDLIRGSLEKSNHASFLVKEDITGSNWRGKVSGKTGIICFEDYYLRNDGSGGDHIDLWDGSSMTGFGSYLRTMFNIVIPSVWSDLSKSKKIRFFPVK